MKIFKRTVFSGVPPEYMAQPAEQCIIYYSKELPPYIARLLLRLYARCVSAFRESAGWGSIR